MEDLAEHLDLTCGRWWRKRWRRLLVGGVLIPLVILGSGWLAVALCGNLLLGVGMALFQTFVCGAMLGLLVGLGVYEAHCRSNVTLS